MERGTGKGEVRVKVGVAVLVAGLVLGSVDAGTLRSRVEKLIEESGAEVALAYRSLDGGKELLIQPDETFHAASTMKIPVMIELFRQARAGLLKLDDPLPVRNEFHSIVDGSPYQLDPQDDSDPEIYAAVGQTRTLRELCEGMITVSSNLATNLLIEKLGVDNIRRTVASLGGEGVEVLRGVEDGKAYRAGKNNTVTARGLLQLLSRIAALEVVDVESSREMIAILKRQRFNEGIPSQLPDGVEVAHKTGQITRIHHDAGIVYTPLPESPNSVEKRGFVLIVLVRGIDDEKRSAQLIGDIARAVYDSSVEASKVPAPRFFGGPLGTKSGFCAFINSENLAQHPPGARGGIAASAKLPLGPLPLKDRAIIRLFS